MHKASFIAVFAALVLLASNVAASYGYYYGGSYSPLHYPNSYYNLGFSYWHYDGPYVHVSYANYSPYHSYSYQFDGCGYYWCYHPAPYYYAPYYNSYYYESYTYAPGYYFGYSW